MRRSTTRFVLLVLALVICASAAEAQKKARGDRTKITRLDLNEAGGTVVTAFDAVRQLQPHWLNPTRGRMAPSTYGASPSPTTGASSATEPVIYIDDMRQPSVDVLRTVKAGVVVEMKYLDQNRAIQMLGPGHESGAIQVTTAAKKP